MIILLLKTVQSLKQLYTITMDVHSRFRTEAHHEVVPRFNERFILSLGECNGCLVLDDELNILPISSTIEHIPASQGVITEGLEEGDADASGYVEDPVLADLKASLVDTPNIGSLVALAKTVDQANAIMTFLDAISEKTLKSTVALTAGRGRGKSAAIGLCLAGAISYGYSNIFVTAPSPENLKTCFEFVISGLKALKYTEHLDFEVLQEQQGDAGKVVVRINVFRAHRQTIQYILPADHAKVSQAELVAIDEAAAIPLPIVKRLMGPYLVFLSSTINGYEGTGRALSLKLIQQLRTQQGAYQAAAAHQAGAAVAGAKSKKGERQLHEERWKVAAEAAASFSSASSHGAARSLSEIKLEVPIRYGQGDPIEKWLNNLLCLDSVTHSTRLVSVMPAPRDCELFMVNRDALFSCHSMAEGLLQRIWGLYTAAHYKNSPNDLQMLSDAPAHRLLVLLGPSKPAGSALPDVLCVLQIAFEGFISQKSAKSELLKGSKASGDLIPWTVAQQFNDADFASLSGVRVVRIATHPDVQKMGYGSRAMDLLISYFQGELTAGLAPAPVGCFGGEGQAAAEQEDHLEEPQLLKEKMAVRKTLPPLLTPLHDRPPETLHWIGVSFGLTSQLLNFWSRKKFKACYLRQTSNDLTGEHSCIMLRELQSLSGAPNASSGLSLSPQADWLTAYVLDCRNRLVALLGYSFRNMEAALALTLIDPERRLTANSDEDSGQDSAAPSSVKPLTASELVDVHLTHHDLQRLDLYARNMVDHHMILDLLPCLATLAFRRRLPGLRMSLLQVAVLLAVGLQRRDVDSIAAELNIPASQVLAFFNKTVRKVASLLRSLLEEETGRGLPDRTQRVDVERRAEEREAAMGQSLQEDQQQDVSEFNRLQRELLMSTKDISKHAIRIGDGSLEEALLRGEKAQKKTPSLVSVPSAATPALEPEAERKPKKKHKQKRQGEDGAGDGKRPKAR